VLTGSGRRNQRDRNLRINRLSCKRTDRAASAWPWRSLLAAAVCAASVWIDIYRAGVGTADRQADLGRLVAQAARFRE